MFAVPRGTRTFLYCDSNMREISLKSTDLEFYTSEVDPRIGWTCG